MHTRHFLGSLLVACVLAQSAYAQSQSPPQSPLDRGRYLVRSIAACGNCHTPQGEKGPIAERELAGGTKYDGKPFTAYAPNITPDKETGIGGWTDAQLIEAIRNGKRPDGSLIGPPMPVELYRGMSDTDVRAIVAYLRTVKPVSNKVPKSEYRIPLPSYPRVEKVADVSPADKVAHGRYLAGPMGHCMECHTPQVKGKRDFEGSLGRGGFPFDGPWGQSVSTDITAAGLERYTDAQLKTVIKTGARPDGTKLRPPMPVDYYARMNDADVEAIIAYLRTLSRK